MSVKICDKIYSSIDIYGFYDPELCLLCKCLSAHVEAELRPRATKGLACHGKFESKKCCFYPLVGKFGNYVMCISKYIYIYIYVCIYIYIYLCV